MDTVDKAKAAMGGFEKFISGLPGIKGYREKELRRDADKQVRDQLARELTERRARITALQSELLAAGGLLWLDDIERAVGRLQLLIDRIKTAARGYAGFFNLQRVKEAELERLANFDQALFDDLPKLDEALAALTAAVGANEGIQEAIKALADLLAGMNETFGRRIEAIRGA
jgi:hypothetical protein